MFENMTFLYVEDDPNSRRVMNVIMTRLLSVKDIIIFEDSENFLERLTSLDHEPDIILLDINVHPLSGFDMIRLIRQLPNHTDTPVIALTASIMSEEVEKLRVAGFNGTISKPLSMSAIPQLLTQVANGESVWYIA